MAITEPLRIAHRGMPGLARENTPESFRLAMDAGANGIELDVHATSDGVVVVHHDPTLRGGIEIRGATMAAVSAADPGVPTLASVLALVSGRAEVFVEIKGDGIEDQVLRALSGYPGAWAIHSFDHAMIARISALDTGHRLGILLEEPAADVAGLMRRTGALDVWPHHPLVTEALVAVVHNAGGRVLPWTVNAPAEVLRLRALGVDGICTDDVRALAG